MGWELEKKRVMAVWVAGVRLIFSRLMGNYLNLGYPSKTDPNNRLAATGAKKTRSSSGFADGCAEGAQLVSKVRERLVQDLRMMDGHRRWRRQTGQRE